MAIDDFKKHYERLNKAVAVAESYKPVFEEMSRAKGLEDLIAEDTGERINLIRETPERQEAERASDYLKEYQDKALKYLKSNLSGLVSEAEPEKLVDASAVSLKHESEINRELAEMFNDYRNLLMFLEGGEKGKEVAGNIPGILANLVLRRIEDRYEDKEEAKRKAEMIASLALTHDPGYVSNCLNEGIKNIREKLVKTGSKELREYIEEQIKEDKDYLIFGEALFNAYRESKEEK